MCEGDQENAYNSRNGRELGRRTRRLQDTASTVDLPCALSPLQKGEVQ